jgi:hypothetical protein
VRGFAPDGKVARIHVTDAEVWLEKWEGPGVAAADESLYRRVLMYVRDNPDASKGAVKRDVTGDTNEIRAGLDKAVAFQLVDRVQVGQAKRHTITEQGREYLSHDTTPLPADTPLMTSAESTANPAPRSTPEGGSGAERSREQSMPWEN